MTLDCLDTALLYDPTSSNTADNDVDENAGYEEFFGGSLPCPTCRGSGRVPRESENQLVALIPFSDKRLKPSRTVTYVIVAVCVCAFIGALFLFFFYPRMVVLSSDMPVITPQYISINDSLSPPYLFMTITNCFNVSNRNYVKVTVVTLELTVQVDQRQVAHSVNMSELGIAMRETREHYVQVNITLAEKEQAYIVDYCCNSRAAYAHTILMPFQATLTTSFLGHLEQSSLQTYQRVKCSKALWDGVPTA